MVSTTATRLLHACNQVDNAFWEQLHDARSTFMGHQSACANLSKSLRPAMLVAGWRVCSFATGHGRKRDKNFRPRNRVSPHSGRVDYLSDALLVHCNPISTCAWS